MTVCFFVAFAVNILFRIYFQHWNILYCKNMQWHHFSFTFNVTLPNVIHQHKIFADNQKVWNWSYQLYTRLLMNKIGDESFTMRCNWSASTSMKMRRRSKLEKRTWKTRMRRSRNMCLSSSLVPTVTENHQQYEKAGGQHVFLVERDPD